MRTRCVWWSALIAVAIPIVGCDGEPELVCGAGTVEMGGVCVPESMLECGPGTRLTGEGRCVPDASSCEDGTSFEPDTGRCVADVECGTGTFAMGGRCVPDGTVICGPETEFDPATGRCLPGEGACGEGTIPVDGVCVREEDALSPEVFSAAEPDEPMFGGTAATFIPPAIGEIRTLGGRILPDDKDGNGRLNPDSDWFRFSVARPGLYRIRADGFRGITAAFAVMPTDGPISGSWLRMGMDLSSTASERLVYLPRAGNYILAVFDGRSVDFAVLNSLIGTQAMSSAFMNSLTRPAGNSESFYHVSIEGLETPDATSIELGTTTGTLGDPIFYRVAGDEPTVYVNTLSEDSSATLAGHAAIAGGRAAAGIGLTFTALSDDGQLVVVDPIYDLSFDPVDFELEVRTAQAIPESGSIDVTHRDLEFSFLYFDAERDDVERLRLSAGPPLLVRLFAPDGSFLDDPCSPGATTCTSFDLRYLIETSGTHLVLVYNVTAGLEVGSTYPLTFLSRGQTPPALMPGVETAVPISDLRSYARADAQSFEWARIGVGELTDFPLGATGLSVLRATYGRVASPETAQRSNLVDGDHVGRIYGPGLGFDLLIEVRPQGLGTPTTQVANLTFDEEDFVGIDITSAAPVARLGDAVPAGDLRYYLVRGPITGELTFTASGTVETTVARLDDRALPTTETATAGPGEDASVVTRIPGGGWVAFSVSLGAEGGDVDIDVSVTDPPYLIERRMTPFATICPDEGGVGFEVHPEESIAVWSDARDLDTVLPGFAFYEGLVEQYSVTSSGWLTFEADASYQALLLNDLLWGDVFFDDTEPNGIVAPFGGPVYGFGDDLAAFRQRVKVCALEDFGRLTVQWEGESLFQIHELVAGLPIVGEIAWSQVQYQVRIEGDGIIEFIYGPDHEDAGEFALIGLSNQDGSLAIPVDRAVAPNTSLRFVPTF